MRAGVVVSNVGKVSPHAHELDRLQQLFDFMNGWIQLLLRKDDRDNFLEPEHHLQQRLLCLRPDLVRNGALHIHASLEARGGTVSGRR